MIKKVTKTDYRIKGANIFNGQLLDEDGNVIDIIGDLKALFGEECYFDVVASYTAKEDIAIEDLKSKEADE